MRKTSPPPIFPLPPVSVIKAEDFKREMEDEVLPALKKCRRDGWTRIKGEFCAVRGIKAAKPGEGFAHWVFYDASGFENSKRKAAFGAPLGTAVILIGFTQSEVRFSELAWYFLQYGLSVLILEHRGHGLSSREISDPEIVKASHWEDYRKDFAAVMEDAEKKGCLTRPLFLFAHSMGGAIGVSIEEAFPLFFDRAVLSSPMLLPKMKLPAFAMRAAAEFMCLIGKGDMRVPGSLGFAPPPSNRPPSYRLRDEWYFSKRLPSPLLHLSDPCCKWSREALRMDWEISRRESVKKILTPTLLFQAEKDCLVDPRAQDRFIEKAKKAGVPAWMFRVRGTRHEIFCSSPQTLSKYLATVIGFYFSALHAAPRLVE
ncbi:MAG: alpha/beta fold hydrolase [Aeriscardovia sp.]|nr:alpha/beta fold hydrolase [Aeriscardovia sp.]